MKKRILITVSIIALVVILAGAAFIGGRLLNGQGLPLISGGGNGPVLSLSGPGGNQSFKLDIQPAKELPTTPADVRGLFDHRKDNSLFIGTGRVTMTVQKDQTGQMKTSSSHDGPTVEVVVTTQTIIYVDVTMKQFNGPPPAGQKIQQVLESGSLNDIGENSTLTVWGRKSGDRIIADVLVYSPAAFMVKP